MRTAFCNLSSLCVAAGLCLASGCGGGIPFGEVTGTVTVDEKPAAGLQILFEPQDGNGPSSWGATADNGTYTLSAPGERSGARVTTHRVSVSPVESDRPRATITIPPRYNQASELTCTVKSGRNTFNVAIVTK
jgi:hypothetical protein